MPGHIVWVFDCQVKHLYLIQRIMGTHGRFPTGEWKEDSSRYNDLCHRNVHNILKLGRDEKGRKPFE